MPLDFVLPVGDREILDAQRQDHFLGHPVGLFMGGLQQEVWALPAAQAFRRALHCPGGSLGGSASDLSATSASHLALLEVSFLDRWLRPSRSLVWPVSPLPPYPNDSAVSFFLSGLTSPSQRLPHQCGGGIIQRRPTGGRAAAERGKGGSCWDSSEPSF